MLPILHQSLWRDEAFSILLASKNPLEIIRLTMQDVSPPFYFLLLHYWMSAFGNTEVVARSLSVLFHFLTALFVFLIARHLFRRVAPQLIVSLVVFLNPFLLQYAFEVRPYSLLALLTVIAAYLTLKKKYILTSIFLALGVLTHNFGILNFFAFFVYWLFVNRPVFKKVNNWEGIAYFSLPVLAILSWSQVLWNQWTKVANTFWIQRTTSSVFLDSFEKFSRGDLSYPSQDMLYTLTLLLSFLGFSYWIFKRKREQKAPVLFFFIAFIPVTVTYVISTWWIPVYHERYLIAVAPMLALLIVYSAYNLFKERVDLRTFLAVLSTLYLGFLVRASEEVVGTSTKPAINHGVEQILSQAQPGDIIVPKSNLNFLETKYYVNRSRNDDRVTVLAYEPTGEIVFYLGSVLFEPREIITEMPREGRVWQINPDGGDELLSEQETIEEHNENVLRILK